MSKVVPFQGQLPAIPAYLKVVEDEGIAIQKQHLGELVGYFFSEIGVINEIVHIWAFTSLDDREAQRLGRERHRLALHELQFRRP